MKHVTLLILLALFSSATKAQITFNEAIGGPSTDQAISAEATTDGGYIVVGWTKSFGAGDWDIYLVKTDASGIIQWTKTYGGPGEEVDCYVHQTFDAGYIITARTTSFNVASADVYLIKTDSMGGVEWTNTIGGNNWDEGHSVIQTPDSGFVHVGFTTSYGAGSHDFYLIRNDKTGSTDWTKSYGGGGVDNGHLIISALNGGYIILGETTSFGAGGYDYYLIKTDVSGNVEWSKTYGGTGDDHGWDIKATNDSCYILAGFSNSFGAGDNDVYLIKVTMNGDVIWSKTYDNSGADNSGLAIRQTNDLGFIIAGETAVNGSDSADVYLLKTDVNGIPQWSSTFGGQGDDGSQSVVQTSDKGYFISGYTNSFGEGDWDFYLIKTDSMGHTATCELATPAVQVTNTTNSTITTNPPTQTSSGGVSASAATIILSGGISNFCTQVTGINSIENNAAINIYPNPANTLLNIQFNSSTKANIFQIYNSTGQEISNKTTTDKTAAIDISTLPEGMYLVKINNNTTKKIQIIR